MDLLRWVAAIQEWIQEHPWTSVTIFSAGSCCLVTGALVLR